MPRPRAYARTRRLSDVSTTRAWETLTGIALPAPHAVPDADILTDVDDPDLAALLAELPDDTRAVEILESARHWLVALADAAGADPARLGMSTQSARKCRRELNVAGVGPTHPGDLTTQLDAYAEATGAGVRHAEAQAIRTAEKAARKASLLEVRAARAQAQADRRTARLKTTTPKPAPKVERVTVNLPGGFDEARHRTMLQDRIVAKHGAGFTIATIDTQAGTAIAVRHVA